MASLRRARPHYLLLAALALANLCILAAPLDCLKLVAGLAMLFVLPGLAWLRTLDWLGTGDAVERVVLLGGLSPAIASLALLGAVYWPGPFDLASVLIALSAATLAGIAFNVFTSTRKRAARGDDEVLPGAAGRPNGGWTWPDTRTIIVLAAIMVVAVFLRWYTLGYGEFHEDEIENMRLAVRAMKGEEYAPFIDSKGPIHWLVPGALWLMHGWVNEALARAPFAICSTLTVVAVYALGRRMAGSAVGLIGSAFVAVNGLLVAYARHVENPSLIVFWAVLAAWCGYRYCELGGAPGHRGAGRLLVVGWVLLGVGLIAHPNMMLYVPPFVFASGLAGWRNPTLWLRSRWALVAGICLCLVLAAAFYVPFVLDPEFKHTVEYFASERIGTGFLYNQVVDLLEQESEYSSRFYTPWLVFFAAVALFGTLGRAGRAGPWLAVGLGAAILSTLFWPTVWVWGGFNAAIVPYALLIGGIAVARKAAFEVRSMVVWFGVPYLALTFLAQDAATHIRNVHPFWALLAGMGMVTFWGWLRGKPGRVARRVTAGALGVCLGAILFYEHLQFLGTVAGYWRAEAHARDADTSVYRLVYGELPRPRKLVSNPRLSGWKAVGALYDQGTLRGDFRTIKESFAVPIWYTHQTPRSCFEDPENYFVAMGARGLPDEFADLSTHGYGVTRVVQVDDQPRLFLLEKGKSGASDPTMYQLDNYAALYDHSATPARYIQELPVQHPLGVIFGQKLRLRGYDFAAESVRAGDTVALSLHWQALNPMAVRYRAFVHIESDRLWGQHDDDPVCRLRTDEWRPPQSGMGQFRVRLDPATPPGIYPVTAGIYDPDTGARLEATDDYGRPLGSMIVLTSIKVE
jgi:hypothetical protein